MAPLAVAHAASVSCTFHGVGSAASIRGSNGGFYQATTAAFPIRGGNSRVVCLASQHQEQGAAEARRGGDGALGRREAVVSGVIALIAGMGAVAPAFADFDEDYKNETLAVIDRVKSTLALEKSDPTKADAVAVLRVTSNDWVAKYRREKTVAGRVSFSNMYSVLNAISGHYISFGPTYPIPGKRKDRILEEIRDAEKALKRGR